MNHAVYSVSRPQSQSERSYLPGSPEKETLKKELQRQYANPVEIPCIIGGKEVYTGKAIRTVNATLSQTLEAHTCAVYRLKVKAV